jgi:dTDP-glucose 4,6-dehydratase
MNQFKKTILITWGAGFIGSHFLNIYVPMYPDILFINGDILNDAGDLSRINECVTGNLNYIFKKIDIRNKKSLQDLYEQYHPTDIIHFAAQSNVDNSIRDPWIFLETNIIWTQNLLDLHKEYELWRFHYISTDEVYGDIPVWISTDESYPFHPSSPYAASKASADLLVQAYGRTYGIDFVITRCSNNYWSHQNSISFIPRILSKILNGEPIPLYGDGKNIRNWISVWDHCEAIWKVFREAQSWSLYNIASDESYTNREVVEMILQRLQKWSEYISFVSDRLGHDKRYAPDATKMYKDFWWSPKKTLREELWNLISSVTQ